MNFKDISTFTRMPTYRVNVPWDYVEFNIARWKGDGICPVDLEPDFQRLHVWTPEQQTKYVEYILSGGMSGREIYFNCAGWMSTYVGPFVIVDGKQRLHAVREFLANRVPIFGGNYRKDIVGRLPSNADFVFCVNNLKTRAEVIKWYLEMNTGGTPHTPAEIDKAKELLNQCLTKV